MLRRGVGRGSSKPVQRALSSRGRSSRARGFRNWRDWSGGRDLNSRSPGPKPEAQAYRIRLDLSATRPIGRKSLNTVTATFHLKVT